MPLTMPLINNATKSEVAAQSAPVVSLSVNLPFELMQMKMREANCRIYSERTTLDKLSFLHPEVYRIISLCLSLQETCTD